MPGAVPSLTIKTIAKLCPSLQQKKCRASRAFFFITPAIWGTCHIPLLERSQGSNWQCCSGINAEREGGKNKREKKQTKALALRSCVPGMIAIKKGRWSMQLWILITPCSCLRQMMEILKERGSAICQICSKLAFKNKTRCVYGSCASK